MKEGLAGVCVAAVLSLFSINLTGNNKAEHTETLPEVKTTEQLIKETNLYKKVEKLEKQADSLYIKVR